MNFKWIMQSERSQSEKAVQCMIKIITFWKWQNYIEAKRTVNISSSKGIGWMDR